MQEMCCAKVCSQEATILVFMGRAGSFFEKKRKIQVDLSFFFREEYHGQVKCYCTLCIIFGQYE